MSGARGKKALDLDEIVNQIYKVQELTLLYPEIVSLDINPMILTEKDVTAVDLKIFVSK